MASQKLSEIKAPIENELNQFNQYFRASMKTKVSLLDRVMRYIVKQKGKQMRPMFVLFSAGLIGEITPKTYRAAALIELLHTATLVHDDVVDDADERRGFFSINALWKNKIAVLVGDFLLSRGLLMAMENDDFMFLKIVSNAVKEMSEGELLQIEKSRKLDIDEPVYFEIIKAKTASLFAACCESGAASASDNQEYIKKLRKFGELTGIAFQIKDDLFDYGTQDVGKPLGIDIKEKKMTLPLIHTLNKVGWRERKKIINIIKNHNTNKKKVQWVVDFVQKNNGLEYSREMMHKYANDALSILEEFPESPSKTSLRQLVEFTINRKK